MTRTTFTVSRAAEFFSEKELQMQMGAGREYWLPMLIKELIDNSLEACESKGASPYIELTVTDDDVTVADNGPGIPADTVSASLEYLSRTSSNNLYIAPTRGQLGNALKCLYAAGSIVHGSGLITITACGIEHTITVGFDSINQQPTLNHDQEAIAFRTGTVVKIRWPDAASELQGSVFTSPDWLGFRFGLFNPHALITVNGSLLGEPASEKELLFSKWKPSKPSPASWYYRDQFRQLLCAHLSSRPGMYVRDFCKLFAGMSASYAQAAVLNELGLQRTTITDAFTLDGEVLEDKIRALHDTIGSYSGEPIKTRRLGVIGKGLLDRLPRTGEIRDGSTSYANEAVEDHCRPFVVEGWFAAYTDAGAGRTLLLGLNHSPISMVPSDVIWDGMSRNLVDRDDPVTLVLHMVCPGFNYVDRGKSRIDFTEGQEEAINKVIDAITKRWRKIKARMRRDERATERELDKLSKQIKVSDKEAAWAVMEQAYLKASGACRGLQPDRFQN